MTVTQSWSGLLVVLQNASSSSILHLSTVSPSSPPSPLHRFSIFPAFTALPPLHLPPPFTIFLPPSPSSSPLHHLPRPFTSPPRTSSSPPLFSPFSVSLWTPPPQSDSAHLSQSENISWQSVNSGSAISLKQKGFLLARRFPPMKSTFHWKNTAEFLSTVSTWLDLNCPRKMTWDTTKMSRVKLWVFSWSSGSHNQSINSLLIQNKMCWIGILSQSHSFQRCPTFWWRSKMSKTINLPCVIKALQVHLWLIYKSFTKNTLFGSLMKHYWLRYHRISVFIFKTLKLRKARQLFVITLEPFHRT